MKPTEVDLVAVATAGTISLIFASTRNGAKTDCFILMGKAND